MALFDKKTEKTSLTDFNRTYQTTFFKKTNQNLEVSLPKDYSTPLSFNEWLKEQDNVEPNSEYEYYLGYITQWYKNKFTPEQAKQIVKSNYVSLLKQLNVVFQDEINEKWFLDLSFSSDLDIQDMIEFYATKLKQIAYFLAEKREQIKSTKIKYNLVGSNFGTAKIFSDYILNAFTQRPYAYNVTTSDIIKTLPQLSGINNSFEISIKELFDETEYFNRDPNTIYFNPTSIPAQSLLSSIGLSATDADWVYGLGAFDSITEPISSNSISLSDYGNISDESLISDLLVKLTEKYIGDTIYFTVTEDTAVRYTTASYNFIQGNNWFYWPSGEYIFESNTSLRINDLPLSETTLLSPATAGDLDSIPATAGTTYQESDRIFVIDNTGIQGAWAQSISGTSTQNTMSAFIPGDSNLLFKFPFPGYGEATDTLPWTGKSLENVTSLYRFLDRETKKNIESAYFSDTTPDSFGIVPIPINDSALVDSGAKPAKNYRDADKIVFRNSTNLDGIHDSLPDEVFTDELNYAWLYDVTRTSLAANQGGVSKFIWPLIPYEDSPSSAFTPPVDFCAPIALSSLNHSQFIGARAGHGLYDSDILYVLDSPNGSPIQAAFLSGQPIKHVLKTINADNTRFTTELSGVHQPGLFLKCFPGQYTTFLWSDSSTNINSTNITYHEIPSDTTYYNTKHNSIYSTRIKDLQTIYNESPLNQSESYLDFGLGSGVGDWKSDESRSVLFSPIGHPGSEYTEYDKMCDIIFVDHTFPEPFSLATWRDTNGLPWYNSPDFGWYKLDSDNNFNSNQPDVGWGPGKWVNGNGTTQFILSAGYQYKYLRASLRRSSAEIQLNAVPYMVIKQPYSIASTKWIKAEYNGSVFVEDASGADTDIILNPGDPIAYDHYKSTSYCLTSQDTRVQIQTTDYDKLCSTDLQAWSDFNVLESNQVFVATWPNIRFFETDTTGPSPTALAAELTEVTWTLTSDAPEYSYPPTTRSSQTLFVASLTAINDSPTEYNLQAIGKTVTGDNVTVYSETVNLKLTALPVTPRFIRSGTLIYETIENLTLPVDICVPLSGWNIETGVVDLASPHAKPVWVVASDQSNDLTKNKAIPIGSSFYGYQYEILIKHQPDLSPLSFTKDIVIDYQRASSKPLLWNQPINYNDQIDTYKWKKLKVTGASNPLSAFVCEQFETLRVEPTDEDSDIILFSPDDSGVRKQYINYFALNDLTWTQPLRLKTTVLDSTVTSTLCTLLLPEFEVFNILNKDFPSVAAIPDITNIISEDEVGIFTPENLGLPVYLGKQYTPPISADALPEFNARWMKTPATFIAKSGSIYNSKPYQKFIPYQNKYDIEQRNTTGINYVKDITDPWSGDKDSIWRPTNPTTTDFRGAKSISQWSSTFVTPVCTNIHNWGTDIYGNNYGLLKPITNQGPYHQDLAFGEIWTRSIDNELSKGTLSLKTVYTDFQSDIDIYQDIVNSRIQKIAIITDKLIILTPNGVAISTILYDYETKQYKTKRNQYITYNFISLHNTTSANNTFCLAGNILYVPVFNEILIPITVSNDITDKASARVLRYNINNNTIIEAIESESLNFELNQELYSYCSTNLLNENTSPVITFNPSINTFNMSYFARKQTSFDGDTLISINFKQIQNKYIIQNIDKLT